MPVLNCPVTSCAYKTEDVDATVGIQLLKMHTSIEHASTTSTNTARAPKIDRPIIAASSSEEAWNTFNTKWGMFKKAYGVTGADAVQQLFHCCEVELGDAILKSNSEAVDGTEAELLELIKKMAVIPVAKCVRRAELLCTKQDHGENIRGYFAKLKGKASTCAYVMDCSRDGCAQKNDFTDVLVKDVLVTGIADEEVRKETLGWSELDKKSLEETVTFIEAKEMARDALQTSAIAANSAYKIKLKNPPHRAQKTAATSRCKQCKVEIDELVWSRRQKKMIERTLCTSCWRKNNPRQPKEASVSGKSDEVSALLLGSIETVESVSSACENSIDCVSEIVLDHHIFDSVAGWKRSESMPHPTLRLKISTDASDYEGFNADCPIINPSSVSVVTDTGAQSSLMSMSHFLRAGFKRSDLLPVRRTMRAANMEEINIAGAVFVRLSGTDSTGNTYTAPIMAYVSPSTHKFYLSRDALVQLGVIPTNFPQVGAALEASSIENKVALCGCPLRSMPPSRPIELPFPVCPENNDKMKAWIGDQYKSSTFNKCTHQVLKGVTGPPLKLHVDPEAKPKAMHVPYKVPLHYEEKVNKQIDDDINLGVLEPVPHGEPSVWCHPMVVTRKENGEPRRTVDMAELNKYCLRETHHVKPPFEQARTIPPNTWKTVTDAWNGFHSVPLAEQDRAKTTFITNRGRFRYRMAPQGAIASGDGYSRRYDEVIADIQRKTKCVDDTALWDDSLEAHWWRIIDFVELCGRNGIVLNFNKFQFAQREVTFAGFRITETEVKPLEKYIKAILDFPTPTRTTDIRSWFGLVHQVAHYNKLINMLEPFKPFLSPKTKFIWNDELNRTFEASKIEIVNAIKQGVEIFDPKKLTCLRSDWSQKGIGYFLSQKHCCCDSSLPGCCESGWRITLAGSRFLRPSELRYAPVEGEALAIAWSLEHTKYFTQGCDDLVIVTDHKPLVNFFSDRTLDQITNARLFSIKQRTLPWRFRVVYRPGTDNKFSDATSRNPASCGDEEIPCTDILAALMVDEDKVNMDDIASLNNPNDQNIRVVTWDLVKEETATDETMRLLSTMIESSSFPDSKCDLPVHLAPYWSIRNNLHVADGVVMMRDMVVVPQSLRDDIVHSYDEGAGSRVVIPSSLRIEILQSLHSAHQGVNGMNERAKACVYWPGITRDIENIRAACNSCNRNMPSNPKTTPIEPIVPSTPFEAVACDYFDFHGHHYLVTADRLTGWCEVFHIPVGTKDAGSNGLLKALRVLLIRAGVPKEVSSDGGPEFTSKQTQAFFKRWGIHHRLSSAYHPSSNGRAEVAVKTAKRLLTDNVSSNGSLDNDAVVRAFLTYHNTPIPGCKLSPAQVLQGRVLRDTLPFLDINKMIFDDSRIHPHWRNAWKAKEEALKSRYVKSIETLKEHSKSLPQLDCGDRVLVQNQSGRFPKKWDKSGTIVEVRANDQYTVRIDGSGRLTLRNRRFLRKFVPHILNQKSTVPALYSYTTNRASNVDSFVQIQPQSPMPPDQRILPEQLTPAQSHLLEDLPAPIETTSATTSSCVDNATSPH